MLAGRGRTDNGLDYYGTEDVFAGRTAHAPITAGAQQLPELAGNTNKNQEAK